MNLEELITFISIKGEIHRLFSISNLPDQSETKMIGFTIPCLGIRGTIIHNKHGLISADAWISGNLGSQYRTIETIEELESIITGK